LAEQRGGTEAIAFQLLLREFEELKQAQRQIPPLLKKIIALLEAQSAPPPPPRIAEYDEMYADNHKPGWYRVSRTTASPQQEEE
jgi:hypothetical protein